MNKDQEALKEALDTIASHARRGTLRHFQIALEAEMTQFPQHTVEQEGENTLVIYRTLRVKGGFLGLRTTTSKRALFKVTMEGKDVQIASRPLDKRFALQLVKALEED